MTKLHQPMSHLDPAVAPNTGGEGCRRRHRHRHTVVGMGAATATVVGLQGIVAASVVPFGMISPHVPVPCIGIALSALHWH